MEEGDFRSVLLRQPVVVVLGHVDSGKTSLLDKIRGTAVQIREAGGITQHIGASFFPAETLKKLCGPLLTGFGAQLDTPGLLVIDTPGHEVFANLRMRGGSAADIAILVVDVTKSLEPQTYESIEILRRRKVAFVVALNKIDMIAGWKNKGTNLVVESINIQDPSVVGELEKKLNTVVGDLSRVGFNSDAYFRVTDFTKQVAIVPVSARTGEGIPDLLTVLVGLTQQYLKKRLEVSPNKPKGIILEVTEDVGLGHTINAILYDGILRNGDTIVTAKRDGPVVTRIKAILLPKPLDEMRDPRDRFISAEEVVAAAGIKVAAPDLEGVLAGSPIIGIREGMEVKDAEAEVVREVHSVIIQTDLTGVIVKADTLGSLEALAEVLKSKSVPIRMADIGHLTRRDVMEAAAVADSDRLLGAILAFGVKVLPDAQDEATKRNVKIFSDPVVFNLIQSYVDWVKSEKVNLERKEFDSMTMPCKFIIMKDMVFRHNDPAIFGVNILGGTLKQRTKIINSEGKQVGTIHQIQDKGKSTPSAPSGTQVAVSMTEPTVGRHIHEGEVLYVAPDANDVKALLAKFKDRLSPEELGILEETVQNKRKASPYYAL